MTINTTAASDIYTGDGTTTAFAYNFTIHDEDDIAVYVTTSGVVELQTITTDYTVSGVGTAAGGTISFVTAPASGTTVSLKSGIDLTQDVDYSATGRFFAETHERGLDNVASMYKKLSDIISRCLKLKVSSTLDADDITIPETASEYLKWNSGATALTTSTISSTAGIADIVDDGSPGLGGDLDTNGYDIQFDDNTGIQDDSGNEQLTFQKTASAVNEFTITNAATGTNPSLAATGGDTNIDITLTPKGSGAIHVNKLKLEDGEEFLDGNGNEYITFSETASAVNHLKITNAATGSGPILEAAGDDTNISVNILGTSTGAQLRILGTATASSEIRFFEDTDNGTNYVGLKCPDSVASNVIFTLPDGDGTSGQTLQTNGSATLSWVAPAASGSCTVLLATATASSSSSVEFTSDIDNTYDYYELVCTNVVPATDDASLRLRTSTDGGSTYESSGYVSVVHGASTGGTSQIDGLTAGVYLCNTTTNWGVDAGSTSEGLAVRICFSSPSSASKKMKLWGQSCWLAGNGTSGIVAQLGGLRNVTTDVDAIELTFDSGNIASGEFKLYGVKTTL